MNCPLIIDFQDTTVIRVTRFFEGTVTGYRPTRRVSFAGMLRKALLCIFITVDGGPSHGSHSSLNGRSFRICHRRRAWESRWAIIAMAEKRSGGKKKKKRKETEERGTKERNKRDKGSFPFPVCLVSPSWRASSRVIFPATETTCERVGV